MKATSTPEEPTGATRGADGIPTSGHLLQTYAADLCKRHLDTVRRARKNGQLPNSIMFNGAWYVTKGDLINAGLLDASMASVPADEIVNRSKAERRVHELELELATSTARLEGALDQVRWYRGLIVNQIGGV